jgi:hypothetical protein
MSSGSTTSLFYRDLGARQLTTRSLQDISNGSETHRGERTYGHCLDSTAKKGRRIGEEPRFRFVVSRFWKGVGNNAPMQCIEIPRLRGHYVILFRTVADFQHLLIAVEGKCTVSSCREIGAVPGRARRAAGPFRNGYRTHGADRRPDRGAHHVPGIASSSRRRAPGGPSRSTTQHSLRHPPCHRAARITHSGAAATDQRGLRRPPTQDKTLTNHSNHQARSPRHKQASPRGTNHRHKASSHPHVAISSSNRRARPRAESPTPHLNLAMLLHGGITASRSS